MRRAASQMFSRTVRPSKTLGTWVLMPMPSRAISWAWAPVMSWPRNRTLPVGRLELPGEHLEEGALAGAVGADQAAQLALGQREVDVAHGRDAAEMHAESPRVCEQRRGHQPSSAGFGSAARRAARRSSAWPRSPSVGTKPLGTSSTKAMRMMPKISGALAKILAHQSEPPLGWLAPSAVVSYWMPMQPRIGPISVPRPPTMTQMMICARLRQAEDVGADESAPVGEQAAGKAGERAADGEGRELVGARIVAEQFGAPLVLADADDDAAEAAGQQRAQPEIGQRAATPSTR